MAQIKAENAEIEHATIQAKQLQEDIKELQSGSKLPNHRSVDPNYRCGFCELQNRANEPEMIKLSW